ncbi:MAG: hypothetical protein U0031_22050 [Thermomicrobiales bacterium]
MDAEQFDRMAKRLHGGQSRRSVLAGLGAMGLGLLPAALRPVETKAGNKPVKCKPACTSCQKCKKNGTCGNLKDFSDCKTSGGSDGACMNGVCGVPVSCDGFNRGCSSVSSFLCCSGVCTGLTGVCLKGNAGRQCGANADCASGKCVGFVCK